MYTSFCLHLHTIMYSFIHSLIKCQFLSLSLSFSILLSLFHPSSPHPPSPPCHQSEGTGSIVIGLQSWQPYDWAIGYCNWIRLEISLVPVRLLKSQSIAHSWRPPFTFLHQCEWKPLLAAFSEQKSQFVWLWVWHVCGMTMGSGAFQATEWKVKSIWLLRKYFKAIVKSWDEPNVHATSNQKLFRLVLNYKDEAGILLCLMYPLPWLFSKNN